MQSIIQAALSRRSVLTGAAAVAGAAFVPEVAGSTALSAKEFTITARPGRAFLVGRGYPETDVWGYNGSVPGPEIRVRQGERVRIKVENRLGEETTVHWHGVRVPNAMDGVPHLTQKPIRPGETFLYAFEVPDAGSYWYHPHQRSFEQVGRGLYGALIVEEREPVAVDRDITWMLGDWRLGRDAQIIDDFGGRMEMAMAGRIGNTVTVNGGLPAPLQVRAGERVRLRLFNAANARIFALVFRNHRPLIIAMDGQPVAPHAPPNGRVLLGPAMRLDLLIDMNAEPGSRHAVRDSFYPTRTYTLSEIVYSGEPPLRRELPPPIYLPPNTMPEPALDGAERHEVAFGGGMMGLMPPHGIWSINGVSATGHVHEPLLHLTLGRTYVLALNNATAWHHPIHLHGHSFRVLARNGEPTRFREWQDTVFMAPRERVDIAFVADNPGDWMLHCHILEHQEGGMMGVVRVA
ncbi:MAG: multicopper oxidase family protein [Hyphomicrobiaceae bacterium]|nr:MAG: multicopper oxidase family protein [Hyphomicrobiaceae bacterium]